MGAATIVSDPLAPTTIYAISAAGNLFKSTDASDNWRSISGVTAVSSLVIDPTNSSILYAATGHGVAKSVDGGKSWLGDSRGLSPGPAVLAIDPSNPATLYAQTHVDLFKTVDGGESWNPLGARFYASADTGVPLAAPVVTAVFVDPTQSSTLYATYTNGFSGVFKSTDGGANWYAIIAGDGLHTWGLQLAIDPANSSTLYVSYVDLDAPLDQAQPHLLKSVDGGVSWKPLDTAMVSGMVTYLLIDPVNTSTLYAGYQTLIDSSWGIAKSTDGGATWKASNAGLPPGYNFLSLAIDAMTPTALYSGYVDYDTGIGGIFKSTDGGASWRGANAGPSIIDATALSVEPGSQGALYAAAGHDGLFKSVDHGGNWARLTTLQNSAGAETVSLAIDFRDPNVLYAWTSKVGYCSYSDKLLFKSLDGGANWTDSSSPPQNPCTFGGFLTLDATDTKTLYVSESDYFDSGFWLLKTSDGGDNWTYLWNRYDFGVDSLVIDPTNSSGPICARAAFQRS